MKGQPAKRQEMLEQIAEHVLSVGLTGLSLRPLAAAIGTSDRMLLYYFADKNELITEAVVHVTNRLMVRLQSELLQPEPYEALLPNIYALFIQEDYRPFMRVWYELVAFGARNEEPFKTISCQIMGGFLEWVSARLVVESEADRPARAALLLGTIEGFLLLYYTGLGNIPALALGLDDSNAVTQN